MPAHHPIAATSARLPVIGRIGWLRGALGAALGILLTGWISHLAIGADPALPWLIAPMGASAVLVFVLPASPLAQPRQVAGGHLLAGVAGMLAHALLPGAPLAAASAGIAAAIAAMSLLRCLHPPAGGTAVLMALGSPAIAAAGWSFLILPVGLNVMLLLGCGFAWHWLTGHSYPHHAAAAPVNPDWVGHIEDADLDAVLADWDEVLDVGREDLLALLHAVEARVRARANP